MLDFLTEHAIRKLEARMTVIEGQLAAMQDHVGGLDREKIESTVADLAVVMDQVKRLQLQVKPDDLREELIEAAQREEIVDGIRDAVANGHHGDNPTGTCSFAAVTSTQTNPADTASPATCSQPPKD